MILGLLVMNRLYLIEMELLPVKQYLSENGAFSSDPNCMESLEMCIDFYKRTGFVPPWICYYVQLDGLLVAAAAFKGKPVNNKVEIAYGTFPDYQNQGIATHVAKLLVETALKTDPNIIVTARTLPEENYSVRLLRKNNFKFMGIVNDEEDGDIWEWEYQPL